MTSLPSGISSIRCRVSPNSCAAESLNAISCSELSGSLKLNIAESTTPDGSVGGVGDNGGEGGRGASSGIVTLNDGSKESRASVQYLLVICDAYALVALADGVRSRMVTLLPSGMS